MLILENFLDEDRHDSHKAGETIFREGDEGRVMYVVVEGAVRLSVTGRSLEKVGPGGVFGEMALIDAAPRSATAFAVTDCKLVCLSRERFASLVQQNPQFALEIMRIMATRLRSMDRRL
jgi:CRP/FNR family transcriptional regulator, cyclic AMP receptor protein